MDINVFCEHFDVTEGIKEHIKDKVSHINILDKVNKIDFRLKKEGVKNIVKTNFHCLGKDFYVEDSATDMYAAIDKITHKLEKLMIKEKTKKNIHMS